MLDRILLTNDDGIDAPGLAVLEDVAVELASEVWVVAPERDQSGQSHAITVNNPLRVAPRGVRRFGVTGTPGDCVVLGLHRLMPERPSLILSGINRGANIGMETVFSGTVGGAMTGMMLGVPSIALSQMFSDRTTVHWETARRLAPSVITRLVALGWDADTCLNVNFPDRPVEQVGDLTLARQGVGMIRSIEVDTRTDPRGFEYHWLNFKRGPREQAPESDLDAVNAGRIAVTPIRYDRTDEAAYTAMAEKLPRLA